MNWKESLRQKLQDRNGQKGNCTEKYNNLLQKIIIPTFKDIQKELSKYSIHAVYERDELKVEYASSGYWFKIIIDQSENCKIKFSAFYVDINDPDLEPGIQPKLIVGYNKEIEIEMLNPDLIGETFYEAFKPMIKYYYKSGK